MTGNWNKRRKEPPQTHTHTQSKGCMVTEMSDNSELTGGSYIEQPFILAFTHTGAHAPLG